MARALLALLLGGLLGAFCRLTQEPLAVDGALALAGVIVYPPQNVTAVQFLNSWTAVHQLLALPLLLGASQHAVNVLHDLILGVCAFGGLLALSLVLVRSLVPAIAIAGLIFLCGTLVPFPDYPISFTRGDFSAWSGAVAILAFGLLGAGHYRAAGCVALLAPAVHSVVGLWTAGVSCVAVAALQREHPQMRAEFLRGALLGATGTAASLAAFALTRVPDPHSYDPGLMRIYLRLWDAHRTIAYDAATSLGGIAAAGLSAAILRLRRGLGTPGESAMLLAILASAVASTVLYEVVHRFREMVPELLIRSMPGRLPGLHLVLLPALLVGALWAAAARTPRTARFAAAIAALACGTLAWHSLSDEVGEKWRTAAASSAAPALWLASENHFARRWRHLTDSPVETRSTPVAFRQAGAVATTEKLVPEVHTQLHLPLLLDVSAIDFVPYVPGTVGLVAAIIEDVYGVDFSSPPAETQRRGTLVQGTERSHWSRLSEADWIRLARKYCIGAIVAPADWTVLLPAPRDLGRAKYYRVPTDLPPSCGPPARR